MPLIQIIAKIVSSPLVSNVIAPAIANALSKIFEKHAKKVETAVAVQAVKAAKTAQDLRVASRKLTDATNRNIS